MKQGAKVAIGLGVGGLVFIATRAQAAPPGGNFAYSSDFRRNYLNAADYMTIEVENIGKVAGICTLTLYTLNKVYSSCPSVPQWNSLGSISHSIEPGEVVTFGSGKEWVITFPLHGDTWEGCELRGVYVRIEGDAGIYEEYFPHFA